MNKINFVLIFITLLYFNKSNSQNQSFAEASGSGVAITSDGYIATNNHVVDGGVKYEVDVYKNGIKSTYSAKVVKTDSIYDLAILKIDDPKFKTFGALPYTMKMTDIKVGERVFAMGYPQHDIQGDEVKVTDGLISSKTGYKNDPVCYQISSPIQRGNSGGPLFDSSGNLIGLTNAGIPSAQNVGYAIKISYLNNFLDILEITPQMPLKSSIANLALPEKVKILSNFTFLIRVTIPVDICDMAKPNEKAYKLKLGMSYNDVKKIMEDGGTQESSSVGMEMFSWEYCDDSSKILRCWFTQGNLYMISKMFGNNSCSEMVNKENISKIKSGMTYNEVCKLLNGNGDFFIISQGSMALKWYSCTNPNMFYRIHFNNNLVIMVVNSM
jgi:hypothetical protein